MGRQPREELVRNLLRSGGNWDTDETFGLKPDISFGWFDDSKDQPQVTVRAPDEGPIDGGNTGYSGIDTTGGSPHQTIDGVIDVHCWAQARALGSATTDFPRQYLSGDASNHGVVEEIKQITRANAISPTDPVTGNQPVYRIAPLNAAEAPEPDDAGDEIVHFVVEIGYGYGTS